MTNGEEPPNNISASSRRRCRSKAKDKTPSDVSRLVDAAFSKPMVVTENGTSKRVSVFAAILQRLWTEEMTGNARALPVRLKYEAFARSRHYAAPRDIKVIGGLPDGKRWERDD